MGLLGGDFDRVMVLSAVQGSLPRDIREDPLLPDDLVAQLGRGLEDSKARRLHERRRFRALVAATSGHLWVSVPRVEMLEGRPLLPSSLVLEELGCTYSGLRAQMTRWGSRAQVVLHNPKRAVDGTEALLARPRPDRASILVTHRWARRMMAYEMSTDRVAAGGSPCAWTGAVSSRPLPASPVAPNDLGWQLQDLGAALLRHVGAWPVKRLTDHWDPTGAWSQKALRVEVVGLLWENPTWTAEQAIDEVLDRPHRIVPTSRLALAKSLLMASVRPVPHGPAAVSHHALAPGVTIEGELGWTDGGDFCVLVPSVTDKPRLDEIVQTIALGRTDLTRRDPTGGSKTTLVTADMQAAIQTVLAWAQRGYFPFMEVRKRRSKLALPDDPCVG